MSELLQYILLLAWIAAWFLALRRMASLYVRALLGTSNLPPIAKGIAGFTCYVVFCAVLLVPLFGALMYRRQIQLSDSLLWNGLTAVGFIICLVPVYRHIFIEKIDELRRGGFFRA